MIMEIELKEVAGYLYVNAEHRIVVRFGYCPTDDAQRMMPICGCSLPRMRHSS